ncbi:type II toxin-antitoxin system VapC family toxin [Sulfuracidifex tepidarius]|nr:type II toxin-antitoxin system VapC family toxin [Sulfuracidifex tepidarius]
MSYVFDSSSIYTVLERKKVGILGGNYTTFLAKFELGNIIWKGVYLHKRISKTDGLKLSSFITRLLNTMNMEDINCEEVEEIAIDYGISFYDASYVWLARRLALPLVTEDIKLRKVLERVEGLKAISTEDVVK